jgi:DNA-binding transcriptional LysR family regulator
LRPEEVVVNSPELIDQLRKLWMLDTLIQQGSFAKAAAYAKVTRSAISQTISQLERAHSKILLIREKGSVKPTPYCLEVLAKVRPLLSSLESLSIDQPRDVPRLSWLDIGAYESLAVTLMPSLLDVLQQKCPGIRLTVKVARSGKLSSMVRKGELCMAIVIENDLMEGLTVIEVGEDRLGYFVSASLPSKMQTWEATKTLAIGDLLPGPDGPPRYHSKFVEASRLSGHPSFTSDSLEAILAATTHGSIVGILPVRVATRAMTRLTEITPPEIVEHGLGRHKICLISRQNCDPRENDFLAAELRALLYR